MLYIGPSKPVSKLYERWMVIQSTSKICVWFGLYYSFHLLATAPEFHRKNIRFSFSHHPRRNAWSYQFPWRAQRSQPNYSRKWYVTHINGNHSAPTQLHMSHFPVILSIFLWNSGFLRSFFSCSALQINKQIYMARFLFTFQFSLVVWRCCDFLIALQLAYGTVKSIFVLHIASSYSFIIIWRGQHKTRHTHTQKNAEPK